MRETANSTQHTPEQAEQDSLIKEDQAELPTLPHANQTSVQRANHRFRDVWFVLLVLLLALGTILSLSRVGSWLSTPPSVTPSSTPPTAITPSSGSTAPATATFREYPLPQANSQVMRLAVDQQGRVWFGEMGLNYLAVFDPQAQTFRQMVPPHGRYGMMGIQVAPDGTIWFAEQYANYIGHYFPPTGRYQIYPLPTLTIPDTGHPGKTISLPSGPNDLALDAHGNVWFTELNADAVGRLDPRTDLMQHYPLGAKRSVQKLLPYGITVDPEGMVWFTEVSNNRIGRLDPTTGSIRFFTPPGPTMSLMEIASDAHGMIWTTSFSSGLLLRFDSHTGNFTRYTAAPSGSSVGGLYGLALSPSGNIWVTVLSANALARLNVNTQRFTYYHIPTQGSFPLALAIGPGGTIWFSEVNKIGMLQP
jgi:virginiamycin B lyase